MSYKILSLKWRPKKFSEIIGQKHISQALSNAIKLGRVAHAFIFSGPRGVGKTSTARILAQELNNIKNLSDSIDVIEMDAASNRGIDEIRNLRESIQYAPSSGKYKIYIIDEAHMLTKEAFNALLKTLEEPPPHVVFILATTELHKMPETIISRTQRYDFKRLTIDDIYSQMKYILEEEKIKFDKESLYKIAEKADGSMRDALSILDQMICICDSNISINVVMTSLGMIDEDNFYDMLLLVGNRKSGDILEIFDQVISSGVSIDNFIEGFIKFINSIIIANATDNDKYIDFRKKYSLDKLKLCELDLLRLLDLCINFQSSLKRVSQPRISVENLLLKLAYFDDSIDIKDYLKKNDNVVAHSNNKIKQPKSIEDKENLNLKKNHLIKTSITKQLDNTEKVNINDDLLKSSSDKNKIKLENDNQVNIIKKNKLSKDEVYSNWDNILSSINKANITHSLEKIDIVEIDQNQLIVNILDINEFIYKNILKDIDLINSKINKYFNMELKLKILYKEEDKKLVEKDKKNVLQDKDNPLFMDVMNKFKGEILR
tara:strand:- start:1937 stop:3574 length:1638 start_codon:yes stop_codon:yes gene_type:complete